MELLRLQTYQYQKLGLRAVQPHVKQNAISYFLIPKSGMQIEFVRVISLLYTVTDSPFVFVATESRIISGK